MDIGRVYYESGKHIYFSDLQIDDTYLYLMGSTRINTASTLDDDLFVAKVDKATKSTYVDRQISFGSTDTEQNGVFSLSTDKEHLYLGIEQLIASNSALTYYVCKFGIVAWDLSICKKPGTTILPVPDDIVYSDFNFGATGDDLYLYYTLTVTTSGVSTISFRILHIDGTTMNLNGNALKLTNTGSDSARGIYVQSHYVYFGMSTNSAELRVTSSQTSYLIKYDLSLGGNDCIQLSSVTDTTIATDSSATTSTYISSMTLGGINFSDSSGQSVSVGTRTEIVEITYSPCVLRKLTDQAYEYPDQSFPLGFTFSFQAVKLYSDSDIVITSNSLGAVSLPSWM